MISKLAIGAPPKFWGFESPPGFDREAVVVVPAIACIEWDLPILRVLVTCSRIWGAISLTSNRVFWRVGIGSLLVSYIILGLVGNVSLAASFDSSKLALLMTAWIVSANNEVG